MARPRSGGNGGPLAGLRNRPPAAQAPCTPSAWTTSHCRLRPSVHGSPGQDFPGAGTSLSCQCRGVPGRPAGHRGAG